eukprot:CFRG3561T1
MKNKYTGFKVPYNGAEIDKICIADTSPQDFYREYIANRKPCILKGFTDDTQLSGTKHWTGEYLRAQAGDAELIVEHRKNTEEGFGEDKKVQMTFSKFLDELDSGSEMFYLTTQEIPFNDGVMALYGSPVSSFSNDFPERPRIVGNLVPQQINMWVGASHTGSTSGLHHDFHDNMYVLLRGRKLFTLFSPDQLESMYVYGEVDTVFENGRILYEGDPITRADGLEMDSKTGLLYRSRYLEHLMTQAEDAIVVAEKNRDNALVNQSRLDLQQLENQFDAVTEALLNDCDEEDLIMGVRSSDDEDAESVFDEETIECESESEHDSDANARTPEEVTGGRETQIPPLDTPPKSFSRIRSVHRNKEAIFSSFPAFAHAKRMVAELNEGDALFLPTGWFHEVTSEASNETENSQPLSKQMAYGVICGVYG